MNKENNLIDLEKEEEQKKEENVITKSLKEGIYYVTKKTKKKRIRNYERTSNFRTFSKNLE